MNIFTTTNTNICHAICIWLPVHILQPLKFYWTC